MDENARKVLKAIGHFYLDKNNGDYAETEKEILRLRIIGAKVETVSVGLITDRADKVTITLGRPGLLIGPRGNTIHALQEWLKERTTCKQILIVEDRDCLLDSIIPNKRQDEDEAEIDAYDEAMEADRRADELEALEESRRQQSLAYLFDN